MAVFVDGNTLAGVTGVGNQNQSSVAALTSDVVVVTWAHASGAPAQPTVIKGQLFSASSGASLSAEFLVSLPDPDNQTSPSVARLSDASFVVTWTDATGDGDQSRIMARTFNLDTSDYTVKTPGTPPQQVNQDPTGTQDHSSVAAATVDGKTTFVVTWADNDGGTNGTDIEGRVFLTTTQTGTTLFDAATGASADFDVSSGLGEQTHPSVAAVSYQGGAGFVVAWNEASTVKGQAFTLAQTSNVLSPSVSAIPGSSFTVERPASSVVGEASVAPLSDGRFAVVWTDNANDSNGKDVESQVFKVVADPTANVPENVKVLAGGKFTIASGLDAQEQPSIAALTLPTEPNSKIVVTWTDNEPDANGDEVRGQVFNLDTVAPSVATYSPTDGATGVPVGANLVLTFNEEVQAGTGLIRIHRSSDDSVAQTFDVASSVDNGGPLTFSGMTLTINPPTDLIPGTAYYVTVTKGAVRDLAFNDYVDLVGTFNFTTQAAAPPSGGGGDPTPAGPTPGPDLLVLTEGADSMDALAGDDTVSALRQRHGLGRSRQRLASGRV
ncbi:MAG TPA: Ig-like domain-containing protein, partial [Microvirga sp.]|nr:Ig-like domain-containing protein [Microvirga sp.]